MIIRMVLSTVRSQVALLRLQQLPGGPRVPWLKSAAANRPEPVGRSMFLES